MNEWMNGSKQKEWSLKELQCFHEAIFKYGKSGSSLELETISKHIGSNRSMLDIKLQFQRYMKLVRQNIEDAERSHPWSFEEQKTFESLLLEFHEDNDKFLKISDRMPSRSLEEITQHFHKLCYDTVVCFPFIHSFIHSLICFSVVCTNC